MLRIGKRQLPLIKTPITANRHRVLAAISVQKLAEIRVKGFTLVEVILSVAIVTAGLIFILQAIGKEINVVSVADDKIRTALFLRQKIDEVERDLVAKEKITPISQTGEVVKNGKSYQWTLSINENKQFANLYEIKAVCSWQKFGREKTSALETRFYKAEQTPITANQNANDR